ncbi:MAG: hypothetical protein ACJ79S_19450 [Gemmatimonadaceae bacterium]
MAQQSMTHESAAGAATARARGPGEQSAAEPRRQEPEAVTQVRASDIEPYTGLRYLSKLFRVLASVLVLFLVAEVVMGFVTQGSAALPTLLAESVKLIVSAALLWASGDLAILLIDIGHDVRATRIFLARQAAQHLAEHPRQGGGERQE